MPRILTRELEKCGAEGSSGRVVCELDQHLGAPSAARIAKAHRAPVGQERAFQRTPGDALAWTIVGEPGVPLDGAAGGTLGAPSRATIGHFDRFELWHESRQILEVAPEPIHLLARMVHGDRPFYVNRPMCAARFP